jgi:hypothetical protein
MKASALTPNVLYEFRIRGRFIRDDEEAAPSRPITRINLDFVIHGL